jgi:ABC-type glycerol-3-phosphate transport system substrate-binding protein
VLKKPLVDGLVVLGIAVNIAFLLINLSPARPHLARRQKAKILLRASPPRIHWMQENEFSEFAQTNDVDFEFVSAKNFEQVVDLLRKEKEHPTGILLADVDDEHADELIRGGAVRSIADGVEKREVDEAIAEYIPEAVERGKRENKIWYLPKRAQLDVAIFLRPAIEDAYLHWHKDRPAIEAALKEANGVGLPRNYELEKTPDSWDSFDLFVAGWYWSRHPAPWAEQAAVSAHNHPPPALTAPRVAHPCGDNEDASDELINSLYRHGLRPAELDKPDAPALLDALQWEALFRKHGLVPPECEKGDGLDSFDVNKLLKDRRLAWAPIDQADSLWVHGGARRDAEPGMVGASDIGWGTLPEGSSIELDKNGEPARPGRSFAFEEVHLWAVPVHSPSPKLAFRVAAFLNQRGLQQRETEAQGMLPIRADLRQDYPILFRLAWMQHMLDASFRQLERGTGDVPDRWADDGLDEKYRSVVRRVVYGRPKNAPVTLQAIRAATQEAFPHGK